MTLSKTFSYILIVIAVYLLIIFPKVVSKNNEKSDVQTELKKQENTSKNPKLNGVTDGLSIGRAGHVV